jgi:demethylmenaquinone methyltransferase / 2-methoxy-6-polyprenyl-1,4-benzoquinol methylase
MTQLPDTQQKASYVQDMFGRIANSYDFMNDIMTFGMHRLWKHQLVQELELKTEDQILDLCCGTGDLTEMLAKACSQAQVTGLDFSEEMLSFARRRKEINNIHFLQGDALALPFEDNTFHKAVVSFGLRNVSDYQKCLQEVLRVCKPGAKFMILDLSHPKGFWNWSSGFYRFGIVPFLGKLIAGNDSAYAYLPNSIKFYPDQAALAQLMQTVGWQKVSYKNIFGGVVAVHKGFKA